MQTLTCRWRAHPGWDGRSWLRRALCACMVLCCGWVHGDDAPTPARVMLLVSYHAGMVWSDEQIAGVRNQLQTLGPSVHLTLDFLDTKNVQPSPTYYQQLEDLLLTKYGRTPPTLLLSTDDDALDLALRMRQRHYPGVPILFSGVARSRQAALAPLPAISGVFDDIDVTSNLDRLLTLRPQTRQLVVVHDQSRTSLAQVEALRAVMAQHPPLHVEFLTHMDVAAIQARLRTLSAHDLVLALPFNRDASGRVLSHEEATDLWAQAATAPLLVTRDVSMRDGVLGGFLLTGRQQGETLGHLAVQMLQGTPMAQLPMRDGVVQPTFEYAQLQRWDIAPSTLPSGSVVLHRPPHALESLRPHVPWLATLFGSMLVIIGLLLNGNRVRRRSEAALRQSELNYRQLFNSSTDAILVRDAATGAIVDTNPRFHTLYGYTAEEALHLTAADISLGQAPYTAANVARYIELTHNGTPQRFTWRSRRKDGSDFWSEVSMTRFDLPHGERIVSTVRDITELTTAQHTLQELNQQLEARVEARNQQLQQALAQLVQSEKLAALGSLVAGVAHELNTPIGNTLMAATTLQEALDGFGQLMTSGTARRSDVNTTVERLQEGLRLIERSTVRAAKLVSDFKQLAVDHSGVQRRHFVLREVVDSVLATAAPLFQAGQHPIQVDVPHDLALDSYPGPLEQVLTHLLSNSAIHGFVEHPGGRVHIQAHGEGADVVLVYADEGCGIADAHQKHVFEPFYTTRLGQGGSGLGLYVVHNLVTGVLGGHIALHSTPGHGCTFTLRLPQEAPAAPQAPAAL